ncbi:scarecrow-like protein 22 [Cinnamomum micranthum f. kanehirae]|uniref:Scarecrow-like protein 22 n=1 Tax=Cinnamomum micranthum f. kanehirae TaxID=337451 RepID=A0A3S4PFM6_9MAGN|nr:scarecrow-like protein 22 [Cinnamomum micranthum f. kanehirae]
MKGVSCHLPGKGKGALLQRPAEVVVVSAPPLPNSKSQVSFGSTEPTSVLDTRSPSPPTSSTSTLSSSFGDTAGMVAASDNPPYKWPPSQHTSPALEDEGGGGSRKEEWANHLLQQPMPASSLEIGAGGCEKRGLGMEEWVSVLPESASSPSNDQSFFQWFGSDMDDPSLKHLLQSGGGAPEFESSDGAGLGIPDMGFGFENVSFNSLANASASANANSFGAPATCAAAATDFACLNGNMMNTSKQQLLSIQNPTNPLPSFGGGGGGFNKDCHPPNPFFSLPPSLLDPLDEKPPVFNLQHHVHPQNPAFLLPTPPYAHAQQQQHHLLPPQPKRRHPTIPDMGFLIPRAPFSDSGQELFLRRQQQQSFSNIHLLPQHLQHKPPLKLMGASPEDSTTLQQQQQALVDQLLKAAELVEAGNSIHAQEILARLNHQLSPVGKPLHRAAFYFKEALQLLLENDNSTTPHSIPISPLDLVFKITAYKAFSEVSPFLQFVNFTSNQVLLEALHGFDPIHIVDFDIGLGLGLGGQWASFMQELALRPGGAPSLKITGFVSLSSQDPLGLCLAKENLSHFANELAIPLEFNLFNIDSLDLSSIAALPVLNWSENEAVAVNLPVGPSTPSLLRLITKQLSPKIVLTVDCGCDRSELPFSHYFFNALQSYSLLLDSLDASNASFDAVQKIERFILQPKIESTVLGRHRTGGKLPPWRSLLTSAGFSPVPLSNFSETQADYLLKRLQLRGFHVEKRQASLCLGWQRGELVSVSAWRC